MSFDGVAPHYRWLERLVFRGRLQAARCAFVRQINASKRALVVGEGDGRFLEELRRAQPELAIDCLDASAKMLALARARVGEEGVRFIEADIRVAGFPSGRYDLVVTHFFLDCFEEAELQEVIGKLAAAATAEATWLIAEFHQPPHLWGRVLIATMYFFFGIVAGLKARRLLDYAPLLRAQGFCLTKEIVAPNEMIRSQRWERRARPE